MSPEEARQYRTRWRLANERTEREWREADPAFKLEQLALMYEAAQTLGWSEGLREGEEEVRERWRRLREFYSGRA